MMRCIKCGETPNVHGHVCSSLFDPYHTTGLPAFEFVRIAEREFSNEEFVRAREVERGIVR